jgi:hypothetical protein
MKKNPSAATLKKLFDQAQEGTLPEGYDLWDLRDNDGDTVAHMAAYYNNLPPEFNRWDLADYDSWTVAHAAAWVGQLPANFDCWDLVDKYGVTVAQVAAENGHLPEGISDWRDLLRPAAMTTSMTPAEWEELWKISCMAVAYWKKHFSIHGVKPIHHVIKTYVQAVDEDGELREWLLWIQKKQFWIDSERI